MTGRVWHNRCSLAVATNPAQAQSSTDKVLKFGAGLLTDQSGDAADVKLTKKEHLRRAHCSINKTGLIAHTHKEQDVAKRDD